MTERRVTSQTGRERAVGGWLSESLTQIRASGKLAERVFELERKGALKSCTA